MLCNLQQKTYIISFIPGLLPSTKQTSLTLSFAANKYPHASSAPENPQGFVVHPMPLSVPPDVTPNIGATSSYLSFDDVFNLLTTAPESLRTNRKPRYSTPFFGGNIWVFSLNVRLHSRSAYSYICSIHLRRKTLFSWIIAKSSI